LLAKGKKRSSGKEKGDRINKKIKVKKDIFRPRTDHEGPDGE
jgi:hypothetical protein